MTQVVFYEKPGCRNNTRQKALLEASGHTVEARNLLTEPWTAERLAAFFGDRPVAEWFNRASPRVKSGAVAPEAMDRDSALAAMLADPLLIRRPLMEAKGSFMAGFDGETVHAWIGLTAAQAAPAESCPRQDGHTCDGTHH